MACNMELPSWSQHFHPAFLSSLVVAPRPDYISQDAPLLLLLTTPHSSVVYTPYVKNNEQLCRQTDTHPSPEKKTRFGIHKVLESRLTSATVFSWLLLSPALLVCSREKPGHRHGRRPSSGHHRSPRDRDK